MEVKAGLLIDFGNSETRAMVLARGKCHIMRLSNKFAELKQGYKVAYEYENGKSTIFKLCETHFANGEIVEREFVG